MEKQLTAEEIAALSGRDLDAAIAERVMGWHGPAVWIEDDDGRDPYLFELGVEPDKENREACGNDCIVPRYHEEAKPLLDVVFAMLDKGWGITGSKLTYNDIDMTGKDRYRAGQFGVRFDHQEPHNLGRPSFDDCFALAVLRAALNAVEGTPMHYAEDTPHA